MEVRLEAERRPNASGLSKKVRGQIGALKFQRMERRPNRGKPGKERDTVSMGIYISMEPEQDSRRVLGGR